MLELAALPIGFLAVTAGMLGLIVGSFLNVVIHRLPRGESVVRPRSRCPRCQRQITALENVPLLSYLWLRGRCRGCGAGISVRYPAIELLTGVLFAAIVMRHGAVAMTPAWLLLAAALIAAAAIDFDHRIIPDEISLGGLLLALACVPALQTLAGSAFSAALRHSVAGAALGGGVLWLVGFAHARYCVARGRRFEHWPGDRGFLEGEDLPGAQPVAIMGSSSVSTSSRRTRRTSSGTHRISVSAPSSFCTATCHWPDGGPIG